MKYKFLLSALISLFVSTLWAQTTETSSHKLIWKGVEKWYADSSSIKVISFDGAKYPDETRLPHFNKRIACEAAFLYKAELKNPVYIPLSGEENELLSSSSIPSEPEVKTDMRHIRGATSLDIWVFPFVMQDGKILKLISFDLQINKTKHPQKISTATRHTYSESSVLAHGKFVKIRIKESGIYKLTYTDLTSMGVDPANVHIFGYGGGVLEQSFLLPKNDDLPELAIWNGGDYILFYAQGVNRWAYDKSKSMFTHVINPYSNYGYYFVSSDAGIGKKIVEKPVTLPAPIANNTIEEFLDYKVYEKDLINLVESGKQFYGETFGDVTSYNFPFTFPNAILNNTTKVRLDVAATSSVQSNFVFTLNGGQTKTLFIPKRTADNYTRAMGAAPLIPYVFSPQSDVFDFNLTYQKSTTASIGYLNYLEVNARRQLKMNGSVMPFQNVDYLGMGYYSQYQLTDANANVQIWDITDSLNICKVVSEVINGKLTFIASSNEVNRYIAIDPTASSSFQKPEIEGLVANQNLHGLAPVDMVIITHPNFVSQAETLAKAHREKDNMKVEVVTTDQVYNEFSSGAPDVTSYRWMMKMLYDRALAANDTTNIPKYLLLFGKGTYDYRKLLSSSGDNFVLTYEADNSLVQTDSYVTDDYFTFLEDTEGMQVSSNTMDIGVGRFTVTTEQEATDVVNKTIGYMDNQGKGYWKNQLCFVADDGDGALHMRQADSIAVSLARTYPAYQLNKIYLDSYQQEITASGQSYPLARSRFQNLLRSGLFLLNYTGHAGPTGWTNESILTANDVKLLSNKHLPLWVAATCDFVQFDVKTLSAGEMVLFNPIGGGIGILAATRPVYASQNFTLDKIFCESLFKKNDNQHIRIGDVVAYTKNTIGSETNKLSYVFVGDPAIKLNYPDKYKVNTGKINESASIGNDTLRALSVATVKGFIAEQNGVDTIKNFNGNLHAVVYDKVQRITTLNNEGDGSLTYSDRQNTLFAGDAEVINGTYSFSFKLPKDIKYNFGTGRINYYAHDNVNNFEAQGFFENFLVGGTDSKYVDESDGPTAQLYLNSEAFVSGDKVNETPLLIANLNDINGINTVGSGIGHDLLLTVDEDPSQSYVLNDYFQAVANSYTNGAINYKLPELIDGKHALTLRVWDLLNNSTTKSLNFEVVKGLKPVIFSVSNYPNPVKTKTWFVVNHDRPETILTTTVDIFDLSGRKIWSFSQPSADNMTWNLVTNDGHRVKAGVYLYRVNIKTSDSDITSKTNKMMIIEQ